MFSWVPLAEPFVQAAQGGVHIAHEVENADADNCEQMGAEMTLNKIGNVQEVLQGDISDLQGDISDLQNTVEAGQKETKELVLKSLQQAKAGQQKLYDMEQRIQSKFMEAAMQVSGLAAQLEDVLRGIEETKEIVELTTYKELSASFTSAVATSSGAYDDVLVALGEMYQQKLKFNIVSKEAVKDWQESTKQMRLIMQGRLQDIWVRSRDSFAEAVTLLTKGDFLAMHYTMLLQSKAILHMEKVQKRARRVYSDWFISHLQKDLEQDELMTTIEAMLLRILSVHAMLGKVFPGGLAMGMLQQQVSGLHEYVIQLKKRLQSESFLHHILYIPMLAKFSPPASSPCVVAAKKAGYQTESLFQWERHSGFKHDSQIRRRGIVRRQSLWEVPLQRKAMPDIEILLLSPAKVYKDPKAAEYFTCSWKKLIEKGTMSDKISQPSDSGDLHMWNKVDSFPAPRDRDTTIRKYMWESDGNVTLTCPESYGTWPGRFSYGPPGQNSVKFEACSQTAEHWLTWTRRRRASRKFKGDDWRANPVYTCNRTAEPHQWSFRLDVACHLLEEEVPQEQGQELADDGIQPVETDVCEKLEEVALALNETEELVRQLEVHCPTPEDSRCHRCPMGDEI
eukprot:Skav200823  [mRNA]  locus=scaffold3321:10642:13744:- [translate_table: standard]